MSSKAIHLSLAEAYEFAHTTLLNAGLGSDHATSIAKLLTKTQGDDCHSHGLYRLISCVRCLNHGKVDPNAVPVVHDKAPGIVAVDARFGFSPLAFETGLPVLLEKARAQGIAAMAINNCFHFSALWPEMEALAAEGLAAIAMTPSHSWVAPSGGKTPVFGTNPFAFGWPRPGSLPLVFDFATSETARGEIELHRRAGKDIPSGWAIDAAGSPTTDPSAALEGAMLPFGGHKGSALSMMIELMAGPLIGDALSSESMAFDDGAKVTPCHGELIVAFDPARFLGGCADMHLLRADILFDAILSQGARLPSQRRYQARARNESAGISIPLELYNELKRL
jgi:delta1-piperideine-2-carboxylate reductase